MRRTYLDGVLDLLLQVLGDVIAVSNVPDARQRNTGSEGLGEAWQPAHRGGGGGAHQHGRAQNSICQTATMQDRANQLQQQCQPLPHKP